MKHRLHETIGKVIDEINMPGDKYEVLKDPACNGDKCHNIPLYCTDEKSSETKFTNVDILILDKNKKTIKVIIEIEESNVKPIHIFGKFLASTMSAYYIYGSKKFGMADKILFIQILDTSRLKKQKTKKMQQWQNIKNSIRSIIPVGDSKIKTYRHFYGDVSAFGVNGKKTEELTECIRGFLSS